MSNNFYIAPDLTVTNGLITTVDTVVDAIRATDVVNIQANIDGVETDVGVVGAAVGALNDLSAADVNTQVDNALNTAIPGSPTVDSINEIIRYAGSGELMLPAAIYASDDLVHSNDTSSGVDTNGSYEKKSEIICSVKGTARIKFDGRQVAGATAKGKIYKNGAAFGTEQNLTELTMTTYSEDLYFDPGDSIELWSYSTGGSGHEVENFRVYGIVCTAFTNSVP